MRARPLVLVVAVAAALVGCANARHAASDADRPGGEAGGGDDDADLTPRDAPADSPEQPKDSSSSGCAFSGTLATWDFTGAAGSQASSPATAMATGVTAGAVSRAAGLNAVTGVSSINSSAWPTSATLDPTKYYTLTLAPPAGCTLSLTGAMVDAKASGTGPTMAAIATSSDAFAQTSAVSTAAPSTPTLSVSGESAMLEVRIYGFGASSANGTLRLQNTLSLTGSLQ